MYFGDDFDAIFNALEEDEAFDDQFTTAVNDVSIDPFKVSLIFPLFYVYMWRKRDEFFTAY